MPEQRETGGSNPFEILIDREAEVPIGVQLAWALRARIDDGGLEAGQRLPGMRELAESTGVNVNTVRAVYQRLDQEGLIDILQGSGTFVAPARRKSSHVASIAANAAQEAHETGVDLREVAAALYISAQPSAAPSHREARRRRALRDEIALLERMIGELEAKHPGVAPASPKARAAAGPALLNAGQLEQVRTQCARRLDGVQKAVDELRRGGDKPRSQVDRRDAPKTRAAVKRKPVTPPRPGTRPVTAGA